MPTNSTYITILREPFSHLKSAYEYYKIEKYFVAKAPGTFDPSNPISSFLKDPYFYSSNGTNFTIIRNSQSADLGIREEHLETTRFQEYLETLDKDFSLVMILEYFDESLLMLKRLLCWELKDILYIPMNENSRKRILPYTEEDRMLYKEFSPLDHALYSFFRSKFASMLKSQNKEFFDELSHFKSLLKEVRFNCMFGNTLVVKATQWHSEFEFTGEDCRLANMDCIYPIPDGTLLVVLALSSLAISVAILKSQLQVHAFRITPFETLKVSTPLRQEPPPRASTCPPAKNVVFIKTHKTGSSTVANIIFRYGLVRKLNFALPNRAIFQRLLNHISIPGEVMTEPS
uniref:Sulfotransferase domain-containing protein n=1 Tax=Biomphalaria glabrata TaxID=6526 RepID=A0A2C9KH74_BIOGL